MPNVTAFTLACSLRKTGSDEPSSSDKLTDDYFKALSKHGVEGTRLLAADHDIFPGVSSDEGEGRMPPVGKVAVVLVVGNEDGAHHCHAACYQALNDVGFTIPTNGGAYWVGEALGDTNYVDLEEVPEKVQEMLDTLASNTSHLARLLKAERYPGTG